MEEKKLTFLKSQCDDMAATQPTITIEYVDMRYQLNELRERLGQADKGSAEKDREMMLKKVGDRNRYYEYTRRRA